MNVSYTCIFHFILSLIFFDDRFFENSKSFHLTLDLLLKSIR